MLIPIDEYLQSKNVPDMSLEELISFRDELYNKLKNYESQKNTVGSLELEVHLNPRPSLIYEWTLECLLKVCEFIIYYLNDNREKIQDAVWGKARELELLKKEIDWKNPFCREVVAHHILKTDPNPKYANIRHLNFAVDNWIFAHTILDDESVYDISVIRNYRNEFNAMVEDYHRDKNCKE